MSGITVFMSHSSKDKAVVKLVRERLARPDSWIKVWYDEADLSAGGDIKHDCREAIWSSTDFTLAFFSKPALSSQWFRLELQNALERELSERRPVVLPINIDPDLAIGDCLSPWKEQLILECYRYSETDLDSLSSKIQRHLALMLAEWVLVLRKNPSDPVVQWHRRKDISAGEWQEVFGRAQRRIWLLGHSMALAVDESYSGMVLADRIQNGVDVRLIVLDPFQTGAQLAEISGQLNTVNLARKIRDTLRNARAVENRALLNWKAASLVKGAAQRAGQPPSLKVGLAQATIHSSIVIVDDRFLITPYSHNDDMGDQGALLDLKLSDRTHRELCNCFENDFRWHWQRSRPFFDQGDSLPRIELRVLNQRDVAANSFSWYERGRQDPPLPHVVVIFPTYRCHYGARKYNSEDWEHVPVGEFPKLLCPNCMYGPRLNGARSAQPSVEMAVDQFQALLEELVGLRISIIEISGGGEPLHHSNARELFSSIGKIRECSNGTRFGLLANVHSVGKCGLEEEILRSFNYVRWTWPEDAELQDDLRGLYIENLGAFVEQRRDMPIRIGVKVLATKHNVVVGGETECPLVALVRSLFDIGIDHVKVRTLRSPGSSPKGDDLRQLEDILSRELASLRRRGVVTGDKTLEVDVKERFVTGDYKCRLSTMISVIDPGGDMRMCWNDVTDARRVIGNVFEGGFLRTWESERHREICLGMKPGEVCNSAHGCHCRIVGYQEVAERALGNFFVSKEVEFKADGFL